MESNLPEVEIKPSLLISHKSIYHICPLSWLVSGVLSFGLYGTECTVYSVMFVQFLVYLFDQSLNKSVNFQHQIYTIKVSYALYSILFNVYSTQHNVGTVFLFDYEDDQILNPSWVWKLIRWIKLHKTINIGVIWIQIWTNNKRTKLGLIFYINLKLSHSKYFSLGPHPLLVCSILSSSYGT